MAARRATGPIGWKAVARGECEDWRRAMLCDATFVQCAGGTGESPGRAGCVTSAGVMRGKRLTRLISYCKNTNYIAVSTKTYGPSCVHRTGRATGRASSCPAAWLNGGDAGVGCTIFGSDIVAGISGVRFSRARMRRARIGEIRQRRKGRRKVAAFSDCARAGVKCARPGQSGSGLIYGNKNN